jgi:hypothetical protein
MKNKFLGIVLGLVLFLGVAVLTFYLIKSTNQRNIEPAEVTLSFYSDWINYNGNPLGDGLHRRSNLLTPEFKDKIDDIIDSFTESSYDPILCAQDFPSRVEVRDISLDDNLALVTVENFFSGDNKILEVSLIKEGGDWLISDIMCQSKSDEISVEDNLTNANKELVENYIKDNISSLSPEEAVLGGTFYVTGIRFLGDDNCLVDYEDGHIAFTALANFQISEANEVEIASFEIQKNDEVNFSEIGNIVLNEDGNSWDIVYEKPGAPALRENLLFSKQSKCFVGKDNTACFPSYWQNGDRVEISGILTATYVEVSTLRVITEDSKMISSEEFDREACLAQGGIIMYPDCVGCDPYCSFIEGEEVRETLGSEDRLCIGMCGNGECEEIVCMGEGCPCPESASICPEDCN